MRSLDHEIRIMEQALEDIRSVVCDTRADGTLSVRNVAAIDIAVTECLNAIDIYRGNSPRDPEAYDQQQALKSLSG